MALVTLDVMGKTRNTWTLNGVKVQRECEVVSKEGEGGSSVCMALMVWTHETDHWP